MTDSENGGGLPTEGYINYLTKRRPDTETPLETKAISFEKINSSTSHELDIDVNNRDQLVLRKDVKALIRDKIEDNSGDSVIQNTKQAAFEELLEELEGEA